MSDEPKLVSGVRKTSWFLFHLHDWHQFVSNSIYTISFILKIDYTSITSPIQIAFESLHNLTPSCSLTYFSGHLILVRRISLLFHGYVILPPVTVDLFHLYSILSIISVATPTTFSGCLAWSITFHPVTLNLFVFVAEMGLLKAACSWVLFFNPSNYCVPFDGWAQSTYIQSDYWYRRLSRAISSFLSAQYLSHFSSLLSLPAILAWRFSMLFPHFLFLICLCLSSGVLLCGYR